MNGGLLDDLLPGHPVFVWVGLPSGVSSDGLINREISVSRVGTTVMAVFGNDGGGIREMPLRGRDTGEHERLYELVTEDGTTIALVKDVDESQRGRSALLLQLHAFDEARLWGGLRVVIDEAVMESVRRIVGSDQIKSHDVLSWLDRTFVLQSLPGEGSVRRVVALALPEQDMAVPTGCRLRGAGVVAVLARFGADWRLERVHRESRARRERERTVLLRVGLEFIDGTTAAKLRAQMREELGRLSTGTVNDSFLAQWHRYHEMENRYALRRLRELSYVEYGQWTSLDGTEDVLRFELADAGSAIDRETTLLRHLQDVIKAGQEIQLECAVELPDVLGGGRSLAIESNAPEAGLLQAALSGRKPVGVVLDVDPDARTVDMRMVSHKKASRTGLDDDHEPPPGKGFLYGAVSGDRRRLERRARALQRILEGRIPLPQLLPLLQGKPARGRERQHIKPLSEAARACFRGRPNLMQELALDAALNTPDIAVIQGPPGTGKTQLIAALQIRLTEEGRRHQVVSQSMLLSSHQHTAVDNLVERSQNMDIPPVKIDSQGRGSTAHIDAWRGRTIEALEREISSTPQGRRAKALRTVVREATSYCRAPRPVDQLAPLLDRIEAEVAGLIDDDLHQKLLGLAAELRIATRQAELRSDRSRQSTLRAVRGIRSTACSFADDGPLMAAAAIHYVDRITHIERDHLELLEAAADWTGDDVPSFLPQLDAVRNELIDMLTAPSDRIAKPVVRTDVLGILHEIADSLEDRRLASAEGIDVVLLEFLEELQGDPEAVLATLRLYTTSLASTCQQADSRGVRDAKDGDNFFDTVIIDEAARANPLDLLIPMTLATKRIILVGDQYQLPHMLEPDVEQELRTGPSDALATLRESLFGRLFELLRQDAGGRRRAVRLNEQFRMHPVLGEFVSSSFYRKGLLSPRPAADFEHGLCRYLGRPAAWLSVPNTAGREQGGQSKTRPIEARVIAEELKRHAMERPDLTFGVISFYSAQVRLIWEELVRVGLAERSGRDFRPVEALLRDEKERERVRLHVGTVDAFQGKEFDVTYLSVTRSRPLVDTRGSRTDDAWIRSTYGHLVLSNRLCVAMSRQARLLVVVGDDALFAPEVAPKQVKPLVEFLVLCRSDDGLVMNAFDEGQEV
ncbi:DEAD/DEAH box helicase [Streptosporangium canum]|uniref:DEAD/DEAH box helicase n=1 Tax=Streptosporangium canum TaxID=324952 RepID=UPI0037BA3189